MALLATPKLKEHHHEHSDGAKHRQSSRNPPTLSCDPWRPLCAGLFAAPDRGLLAAIISNDVTVVVTLAGIAHGDFCFLHHRTHIAENGEDFGTLSKSLVALVAMVVITIALLAQQ